MRGQGCLGRKGLLPFEIDPMNGREARESGLWLKAAGCARTDGSGNALRTRQLDLKADALRCLTPMVLGPVQSVFLSPSGTPALRISMIRSRPFKKTGLSL